MSTPHSLVIVLNNHERCNVDSDAVWISPSVMTFANGETVYDDDEFNADDVWWSLATNHLRQAAHLQYP